MPDIMGRTIPKSMPDRLSFFLVHAQRWAADPEAIGLTSGEIASLQSALSVAEDARAAAQQKRNAAEAATHEQNQRMDELVTMGSGLIAKVRAFAAQDSSVIIAAGLDLPAGPTFTGIAPPTPGDLICTPMRGGALVLSWTSDLKRTSFYQIERELTFAGRTSREFIAAVRADTYTDAALPVGYTYVTYLVTPIHQRGRDRRANVGSACLASYTPGTVHVGAATPAAGIALAA